MFPLAYGSDINAMDGSNKINNISKYELVPLNQNQ